MVVNLYFNFTLNKMKRLTLNSVLIGFITIVLAVNSVVMIFYTQTTNARLTEAISLAKPQPAKLTLITADECSNCKTLETLEEYIEKQNVELSQMSFSFENNEAQKLINLYEIKRLPVLIFETEGKIKTGLKKSLEKGSREVGENILIWEQAGAPYFDIEKRKTEGLVEVTFITDKSCVECYNPEEIHGEILKNFGVVIIKKQIVDAADPSGLEIIKKYNVTSVPTMILSDQAAAYENLETAWSKVGTIEDDGKFVFRDLSILKETYKDLKTGKAVIKGQN